jgi:hypothetical protein
MRLLFSSFSWFFCVFFSSGPNFFCIILLENFLLLFNVCHFFISLLFYLNILYPNFRCKHTPVTRSLNPKRQVSVPPQGMNLTKWATVYRVHTSWMHGPAIVVDTEHCTTCVPYGLRTWLRYRTLFFWRRNE